MKLNFENGTRVRRHTTLAIDLGLHGSWQNFICNVSIILYNVRRREEEITSSQESHPLLGPELVNEPVVGTQTQQNSREPGVSSMSSSNSPLR